MKNYILNIAGYNIRIETSDSGLDFVPAGRFRNFAAGLEDAGLLIRVYSGKMVLPAEAKRVFHAPYIEEKNGIKIERSPEFWSIWKYNQDLFIETLFPQSAVQEKAVLKFSLDSMEWDLWIDSGSNSIDPLEYPLDGLVLYYLTVIHGDIMIHSSGVSIGNKGYLFSGVSGKGKTTMAGFWNNAGAKVIHDDRLVLRKTNEGYMMHNTPVYNDEEPEACLLSRIFIIEHGLENRLIPLKESNAVSLVMANCIQHNWWPDIIATLLDSVSDMCSRVRVSRLAFRPDSSIIDYILDHE